MASSVIIWANDVPFEVQPTIATLCLRYRTTVSRAWVERVLTQNPAVMSGANLVAVWRCIEDLGVQGPLLETWIRALPHDYHKSLSPTTLSWLWGLELRVLPDWVSDRDHANVERICSTRWLLCLHVMKLRQAELLTASELYTLLLFITERAKYNFSPEGFTVEEVTGDEPYTFEYSREIDRIYKAMDAYHVTRQATLSPHTLNQAIDHWLVDPSYNSETLSTYAYRLILVAYRAHHGSLLSLKENEGPIELHRIILDLLDENLAVYIGDRNARFLRIYYPPCQAPVMRRLLMKLSTRKPGCCTLL